MGLFNISLLLTVVLAVVGATIETYSPGFFSKKFKSDASALTLGLLGIVCSTFLLMIFLKVRIREGFEEKTYQSRWDAMVNGTRVSDVCNLYTEIYEKIMLVEKGAPPDATQTDAQAREATDRKFASVMSTTPVSCALFQEVESRKGNLDDFFVELQKLPDNFFAQVLETAIGCRSLLIQQYMKVQEAEKERKEGFEDIPICSQAAAKQRKEMKEKLKLSQEAQQCILPEEIAPEQKMDAVNKKLARMASSFQSYRNASNVKDSIQKILDDAMYYKKELDKKKQKTVDMSNKYNFK